MDQNGLLDQAEDFFSQYLSEDTDDGKVFRRLIDEARIDDISDEVRSAATALQEKAVGSTMSLLIHKMLHGGEDRIDQWDLRRWIAATESEKGPSHATRLPVRDNALHDLKPGTHVVLIGGREHQVTVVKTKCGYSAEFLSEPATPTVAPTALEAVSKAAAKLRHKSA